MTSSASPTAAASRRVGSRPSAGELAGSIALLVYAYNEGGAALVAAYGVVARCPRC